MALLANLLATLLFISTTLAHSQLRCAKYDVATDTCSAPIRNQGYAFMRESNEISSGLPICQDPMSNPITAFYGNGASCPDWAPCPDQMGTYKQGETFTIMWFARNHAVPNQNPGSIVLYISPVEAGNQGKDFDKSAFTQVCTAPYASCAPGQPIGDTTRCYTTCTMPANTAVGYHTLWWKWDWQTAIYSTCADIMVTSSSTGSASSSSSSSTTGQPAMSSSSSSTTGQPAMSSSSSSTTGQPAMSSSSSSTTGQPAMSSSSSSTSAQPASTTSSSSSTTGRPASTSSSSSSTTGRPASTSTTTGSSSNSCSVIGSMKCVTSETYSICDHNMWSAAKSCQRGATCHVRPDNTYIDCY